MLVCIYRHPWCEGCHSIQFYFIIPSSLIMTGYGPCLVLNPRILLLDALVFINLVSFSLLSSIPINLQGQLHQSLGQTPIYTSHIFTISCIHSSLKCMSSHPCKLPQHIPCIPIPFPSWWLLPPFLVSQSIIYIYPSQALFTCQTTTQWPSIVFIRLTQHILNNL